MGVFYQKLTSQLIQSFPQAEAEPDWPYRWGSMSEGSFHWAGEDESRGSHHLIPRLCSPESLGIVRNVNSQVPPQPYRKAALRVGPAVCADLASPPGILMHPQVWEPLVQRECGHLCWEAWLPETWSLLPLVNLRSTIFQRFLLPTPSLYKRAQWRERIHGLPKAILPGNSLCPSPHRKPNYLRRKGRP